jgi:hypothetical protein
LFTVLVQSIFPLHVWLPHPSGAAGIQHKWAWSTWAHMASTHYCGSSKGVHTVWHLNCEHVSCGFQQYASVSLCCLGPYPCLMPCALCLWCTCVTIGGWFVPCLLLLVRLAFALQRLCLYSMLHYRYCVVYQGVLVLKHVCGLKRNAHLMVRLSGCLFLFYVCWDVLGCVLSVLPHYVCWDVYMLAMCLFGHVQPESSLVLHS